MPGARRKGELMSVSTRRPAASAAQTESEIRGQMAVTAANTNPNAVILQEDPLAYYVDDVLSEDECALLIAAAKGRMKRATVVAETGDARSKVRTNSVIWMAHDERPEFQAIAERIALLVGLPLAHSEDYQIIHYRKGAEYKAHLDGFDFRRKGGQMHFKGGGQRITTALCYLNDVALGGETQFPNLGIAVSPKRGRLLVFNNCPKDSIFPEEKARHGALPVKRGEKWAFNFWFRQWPRAYQPAKPAPALKPPRKKAPPLFLRDRRRKMP